MNQQVSYTQRPSLFQKICNDLIASCLAVMAIAVFVSGLLRCGFVSGIAASEELSRLLSIWMVCIGTTAANPVAGDFEVQSDCVGSLAANSRRN